MSDIERIIGEILIPDVKTISIGVEKAETQSAVRDKMLSAQIDGQFDALESLLTVNHKEIIRANR